MPIKGLAALLFSLATPTTKLRPTTGRSYPDTCAVCQRPLRTSERQLCKRCADRGKIVTVGS